MRGKIQVGANPASSKKPVVHSRPRNTRIVSGASPGNDVKRWAFTFRFWKQIEFFGLDKTSPTWFVSVFEKLQELSTKSVDEFLVSAGERDTWRYHEINWGQKNIPIQRSDLKWIDPVYLNNAEDYPLFQFQITTSLGRVVGFWDDNSQFNIVLFDPLHNIQPSKSHGYKVDPCSPLSCDYTLLLDQVNQITNKCSQESCQHSAALKGIKDRKKELESFNVLMMRFSDDAKIAAANELIEKGVAKSHAEIFEYGVDFLNDQS